MLRDRPLTGYALLLLTGLALCGGLVWGLLATEALAAWLGSTALGLWLVALVVAVLLWWRTELSKPVDQALVAEYYRRAAVAFLNGDSASALQAAQTLTQQAPLVPGAWLLLAKVATQHGDASLARRSEQHYQHLLRRDAAVSSASD